MNPFTPGWGLYPPVLVGRQRLLAEYREALQPAASQHEFRRTHLVAPRGSGKTVMMDAIQDTATEFGWITVQADGGTDVDRLGERLVREIRKIHARLEPPASKVTSFNLSAFGVGIGAGWQIPEDLRWADLRSAVETIIDTTGAGLLVTIDEVHELSRSELHEFGNAFQHITRSRRPLAVALAGLPADASDQPTFLRRTLVPPFDLRVEDREIQTGLRQTAAIGGWRFDGRALAEATAASVGVPYMMQLVGSESVKLAIADRTDLITTRHVAVAIPTAGQKFASSISARLDITAGEMRYLLAMAHDDLASSTGQIAQRLNVSLTHGNVLRTQLIERGIIHAPSHGRVEFVEHWLRPVLRSLPEFRNISPKHKQRTGFDTTQHLNRGFER